MRNIYFCMLAVEAAVTMLGCCGCQRNSRPIRFILPNEFSGLVAIRLDSTTRSGLMPTETGYAAYIPSDGKLLINDFSPFLCWHGEAAERVNGTNIPRASLGELPQNKDEVFFWGLGSNESCIDYFVGTLQEQLDYRKKHLLSGQHY